LFLTAVYSLYIAYEVTTLNCRITPEDSRGRDVFRNTVTTAS